MAIGKASDLKVYNEEFQGGLWEGITQNTSAFNGASLNAIRLVTADKRGDYEKEAFYKSISGLITRRDTTSVSSATDLALSQDELISVKVNRKIGPAAQTLDAFRKIAKDQREMSFILGKMIGEKKAQDLLNTGILAVEAAIQGQTALNLDITGETTKTLTTDALVRGLAKFGDAASRIVAWVMHSKPFFNLIGSQIADKVVNVADKVVYGAVPATLGRPVIVTDAPGLTDANGSAADTYNIMGLVEGAVIVTESEQSDIISEIVTGLENLVFRIQGEYAFNVQIKGFKWDVSNGGPNPLDTALGTTTNWDKAATDDKDLSGVRIVSQ